MPKSRNEIVQLCLNTLASLRQGFNCETDSIEIKREIPQNSRKAARLIAAAANASDDDDVIWLIGIDEKTGQIEPAQKEELSAWYQQLTRFFDGPSPRLRLVENVWVDEKPLVTLVFEGSERPYVMKLDDGDSREIPWRQGNRTRSATREELTVAPQCYWRSCR